MIYIANVLVFSGQPEVIVMPFSQTVEITLSAVFTARTKGVGVENFRYTWFHNGIIFPNESHHMLIIHQVTEHDKGYYRCRVSNMYNDHVRSNRVFLNVKST